MRGMRNSPFIHSCQEGKLGRPSWKAIWKCRSNVFSLAIIFLELSSNKQNAQIFICKNVYFGPVFNSEIVEAICMSKNRELI